MDQVWVTDFIGYVAAALGTFVMLPQVVKTLRTRSAEDVSGVMLGVYLIQCILWGVYGVRKDAVPLIACNVAAFFLAGWQSILKWRFQRAAGAFR
jgi:MtN3 and saliva related transmembrane protein